jgi:hypothetical protein
MSADQIREYLDAMRAYRDAKKAFDDTGQFVRHVTFLISSDLHKLEIAGADTRHWRVKSGAETVDMSKWPTGERITELVAELHRTTLAARAAWNQIAGRDQADLQKPPA